MRQGGRFTAWFSPTERHALELEARRESATVSWVIRRAVCKYLGTEKLKQAAEDVMDVTSNNR